MSCAEGGSSVWPLMGSLDCWSLASYGQPGLVESGLFGAAWIGGVWPLWDNLDWWSLASLGQPGLVESGLFGTTWIGGVWPLWDNLDWWSLASYGQPGLVESGLFGTTWIGGVWPLWGSLDWWSLASLVQPGLVESGLFGAAWIAGRLVVPSQRGSKSLSRTFSFTVPGRWNDLPTPIRNAGSLSIFKQQLKTHLFQLYLTTWKKNKKNDISLFSKSSSFSLSFSPSLASMYLFEQCLRLGVIGTSSLCLPLQD